MRVLVGCERSGVVRDAFRRVGVFAVSCDLEDSMAAGPHLRFDVFDALEAWKLFTQAEPWGLFICHPPCTYLSSSGLHWNSRIEGRDKKTEEALDFAERLWNAPVERICLENPIGALSRRLGKPTQIIHPHDFGDDASKATCLWLKNLPPLRNTGWAEPREVDTNHPQGSLFGYGTPRWSNQTDSGQNRLGPSPERAQLRAQTYPGIALAMAEQWGGLTRGLTKGRIDP